MDINPDDVGGVGQPQDVPADTNIFASTDGRLFVDLEWFAEAQHASVHTVQPVLDLVKGMDFTDGMHAFAAQMHADSRDAYRELVGLPARQDNVDGDPTDDTETVGMLNSLWSMPSFGDSPDA